MNQWYLPSTEWKWNDWIAPEEVVAVKTCTPGTVVVWPLDVYWNGAGWPTARSSR